MYLIKLFTKGIKHSCSRDPEWADVKLAQAKYLLSRLSKFKTLVSNKFQCEPSVLVAGDFNSLPEDKVSLVLHITFSEFGRFPSLVTRVLVKVRSMHLHWCGLLLDTSSAIA